MGISGAWRTFVCRFGGGDASDMVFRMAYLSPRGRPSVSQLATVCCSTGVVSAFVVHASAVPDFCTGISVPCKKRNLWAGYETDRGQQIVTLYFFSRMAIHFAE